MWESWGSQAFDKGDHLNQSDMCKSIGQEVINNMGLREVVNVTASAIPAILERPWQSVKIPNDWKKAKVTSVFLKKTKKE